MTHPNKPLTPRLDIHHQNAKWAQTKKRCTLKKRDSDLWVRQKWPIWTKSLLIHCKMQK